MSKRKRTDTRTREPKGTGKGSGKGSGKAKAKARNEHMKPVRVVATKDTRKQLKLRKGVTNTHEIERDADEPSP